ncbi:MAG: hypothetical protein IH921_10970 [Gemmatimonadetes bacterium]|nr:hypothetical protein [Gemmatimonadota bacterium]
MNGQPWYWREPRYDHWAVGLVACAGTNERIHYSRAGKQIMAACGGGNARRQPKNVRLLEGPRIVDCRLCAAIARHDRDLIDQRDVKPVIKSHDRVNFIGRERARKQG